MAYPTEGEHKSYMDYVITMQEEGKKPLPKEEWRKRMKKETQEGENVTRNTILSDG